MSSNVGIDGVVLDGMDIGSLLQRYVNVIENKKTMLSYNVFNGCCSSTFSSIKLLNNFIELSSKPNHKNKVVLVHKVPSLQRILIDKL